MFDDRQYVVVFSPGDPIGRVDKMSLKEASQAVGGFATQFRWGNKYCVYHNSKRAEVAGEIPNRMFDGRVLYGLMIVVGWDKPLKPEQAARLAYDSPWRMARYGVSA